MAKLKVQRGLRRVLEKAGLSFLRAFGAAAATYGFGIWQAPNLNQAYLVAAAAVVAGIVAGIRALQEFVPALKLSSYLGGALGGYADAFLRAFLGALAANLTGLNAVPDLSTGRAVATSAVVGALAAALKGAQGAATRGESPAPQTGV